MDRSVFSVLDATSTGNDPNSSMRPMLLVNFRVISEYVEDYRMALGHDKFVNVEERMIPGSISETAIPKGSNSYLKDSLKP